MVEELFTREVEDRSKQDSSEDLQHRSHQHPHARR